MARKPTRLPLKVYLNSRLVGQLRRETSGAIDFQYDQSWLDWEHSFAISLSLPLREDRYFGDAVIAVFDNLLPDNDEIRRRVAAHSGADGIDPYSMLSAIGRDCVGALQFLADGIEPGIAGAIDGKPINDEAIAELINNLATSPLGIDNDTDFRISIAGAQDKTALLNWQGAWHLPKATSATTHILKPQIGQRGMYDLTRSVENEHLCLEILRAFGLPVARTQIADFAGTRVLVVKRFDREWTTDKRLLRVPQEDCCQALSIPPVRKYQNEGGPGMIDILELLKASDEPSRDQLIFLQAQIIFWLLAAIDGHAKNFSISLHPGGGFELAPLYDVMSAQPLFANKQIPIKDLKLSMAVGNNRHYQLREIQPRHYVQTAARAGLPEETVDRALEEVADTLPDAIRIACETLPDDFPEDIRESIAEGALKRCEVIGGHTLS